MFEKVNPSHPDKIADRIAGAVVDIAYALEKNPKIAVEVLIGHGQCHIILETSTFLPKIAIEKIVKRITKTDCISLQLLQKPQDSQLYINQIDKIRCGDNGIFKGMPITSEEQKLGYIVRELYEKYPTDGKYILADEKLIACQSCVDSNELSSEIFKNYHKNVKVNPLGDWQGGINTDTGATNRKIGSDMGAAATGGGLHGKDLSKADVSVNIYAHLKAQATEKPVELYCAIGDDVVDGRPYSEIVEVARKYIFRRGGFEKFAEWGLI